MNKISARNRAQTVARGPIPLMALLIGGSMSLGIAVGAVSVQPANATVTAPAVVQPAEDDPAFDCRIHSNQRCGVEIEGEKYIVQFLDGLPVQIAPRGF